MQPISVRLFMYIKTFFLYTKGSTCAKNVFFCVSREKKLQKKFCFTRNIFYFCSNIGKGSVEST